MTSRRWPVIEEHMTEAEREHCRPQRDEYGLKIGRERDIKEVSVNGDCLLCEELIEHGSLFFADERGPVHTTCHVYENPLPSILGVLK